MRVTGVVLAGGLSRRMHGREKAFLPFGEGVLLDRTLARFAAQVERVVLSANGDPSRFVRFGAQVIPDPRPGHPGPLAGVEAAFLATGADWLLSVPVDLPFLPMDLGAQLGAWADRDNPQPVVAASGSRLHPVVCLWPRVVLPWIQNALDAGQPRLLDWFATHPHRIVSFDRGPHGVDPFFNVNTPDALMEAAHMDDTSAGERPCMP
ncbi:MAG: molybdenum cofactor guanylyltransferase [Magnetococcales bacterium]|nr:molybdenum cofactor guanylyltransferase [Magnetococcales bacterium]